MATVQEWCDDWHKFLTQAQISLAFSPDEVTALHSAINDKKLFPLHRKKPRLDSIQLWRKIIALGLLSEDRALRLLEKQFDLQYISKHEFNVIRSYFPSSDKVNFDGFTRWFFGLFTSLKNFCMDSTFGAFATVFLLVFTAGVTPYYIADRLTNSIPSAILWIVGILLFLSSLVVAGSLLKVSLLVKVIIACCGGVSSTTCMLVAYNISKPRAPLVNPQPIKASANVWTDLAMFVTALGLLGLGIVCIFSFRTWMIAYRESQRELNSSAALLKVEGEIKLASTEAFLVKPSIPIRQICENLMIELAKKLSVEKEAERWRGRS